jgi:hypothetical protein
MPRNVADSDAVESLYHFGKMPVAWVCERPLL